MKNIPIEKGQIPLDFIKEHQISEQGLIGCWVNGVSVDLMLPAEQQGVLKPIRISDMEGQRIYQRTLCFILWRAVSEIFRDTDLLVNHSMSSGYYCEIVSPVLPTKDEIEILAKRMEKIIAKDEVIERERITKEQGLNLFRREGRYDTVRLLRDLPSTQLVIYRSGPVVDSYTGPIAPRTGILKWWSLIPYHPGVVIHFPTLDQPDKLIRWEGQKKLFKVYHEHRRWIQILEVLNTGQLNTAIAENQGRQIINVAEALHEKKISAIADEIYADRQKRLILISGPSSSGKTTFSRRLKIALLVNGLRPIALSLDNFFLDREDTPKDEQGNYDFESPRALDMKLFQATVDQLLDGKQVNLPKFDFNSGTKKESKRKFKLQPGHPIIIEGIHALNDKLTEVFDDQIKFKIYASALTQVNLDDHNRFATTDCRMIRRIVRDSKFRSYTASETINRWYSIRRGENRWIFPFQETADAMFNSALIYEISALKPIAEKLLSEIELDDPAYEEAQRLLGILDYFLPVDTKYVPFNSVLREFIGGSVFEY
ncbi:MAG: hypothetical protein APR63_12560 [Desulfuromonas sp. SDB]|nr:MAG: hypothetical protein APR63_12560 [Desulfuromonas sp. SDB]